MTGYVPITSRACPGGHGYQLGCCPTCDAEKFAQAETAHRELAERAAASVAAIAATRRAATFAQPRPGTVTDRHGKPCPRASRSSYPLHAVCESCGQPIRCSDGTADWTHPAHLTRCQVWTPTAVDGKTVTMTSTATQVR